MAETVSKWSKDPSTRCGAVIVDSSKRILGLGYNGLPRGVEDTEERLHTRELKYSLIVHAEVNAILNASTSVSGATLYVLPLAPCHECAKVVIQSGITTVICPKMNHDIESRWSNSVRLTREMFAEAGVLLREE